MPGGPASSYGAHGLGGVYYAIVTQNDDPEGPGGRIKVRYPWMPEGDRDQSYWAPIVVPMIGAEFGTYTLPDVNDEVLEIARAKPRVQENVEFRREDAYAELEEILRDEPEWAGTLFVAPIELDERHVSSN